MPRRVSIVSTTVLLATALLACAIVEPSRTTDLAPPPTHTSPAATEAQATQAGGVITGQLSYPSERTPAERVVAFDAASLTAVRTVDTAPDQATYLLPVPAGVYFVVAYTTDGRLAGGYSAAVPCGLSVACNDHSLIPLTVADGAVLVEVNPADWYAPDGAFPPMP